MCVLAPPGMPRHGSWIGHRSKQRPGPCRLGGLADRSVHPSIGQSGDREPCFQGGASGSGDRYHGGRVNGPPPREQPKPGPNPIEQPGEANDQSRAQMAISDEPQGYRHAASSPRVHGRSNGHTPPSHHSHATGPTRPSPVPGEPSTTQCVNNRSRSFNDSPHGDAVRPPSAGPVPPIIMEKGAGDRAIGLGSVCSVLAPIGAMPGVLDHQLWPIG